MIGYLREHEIALTWDLATRHLACASSEGDGQHSAIDDAQRMASRQRAYFGKWVGERRDWFFEQVEDRPMGGVPKWLRQSLELVPGSVREANDPVTH